MLLRSVSSLVSVSTRPIPLVSSARITVAPRSIRLFSSASSPMKKQPLVPSSTQSAFGSSPHRLSAESFLPHNHQHPPIDQRVFGRLSKTVIIWCVSISIWAAMVSTFGYSAWWWYQRELARQRGEDLEEWMAEMNAQHTIDQVWKRAKKE